MKYFEITEDHNGKRIDLFNENWYPWDGEFYPSVTYVQSKKIEYEILQWTKQHGLYVDDILAFAKKVGSLFHGAVDTYIKTKCLELIQLNEDSDYTNPVWERMENFEAFRLKHLKGHTILKTEHTIINKELQYAGTLDLLTKDPKSLKWVWDWKTGKQVYDKHRQQVSAYAKAVDADFAVVVCFPENPKTKQGYSMSILDRDGIDKHFKQFVIDKRCVFDITHSEHLKDYLYNCLMQYKERINYGPKFKSLPIKYEWTD